MCTNQTQVFGNKRIINGISFKPNYVSAWLQLQLQTKFNRTRDLTAVLFNNLIVFLAHFTICRRNVLAIEFSHRLLSDFWEIKRNIYSYFSSQRHQQHLSGQHTPLIIKLNPFEAVKRLKCKMLLTLFRATPQKKGVQKLWGSLVNFPICKCSKVHSFD